MPQEKKKILKVIVIGMSALVFCVAVIWLVCSVFFIRQISTFHELAQNRSLAKPVTAVKIDTKTEASTGAGTSAQSDVAKKNPDDSKKSEEVKKDKVKSVYEVSRAVLFLNKTLKSRDPESLRPTCSVICDNSSYSLEKENELGPIYFEDFFAENKERVFDDFYFRINLRVANLLRELIGEDFFKTVNEAYNSRNQNMISQAELAVRINYQVAVLALRFRKIDKDMDAWFEELKELEKLPQDCGKKSFTEIQDKCEMLLNSQETQRLQTFASETASGS
ncbi:MAG: hypothetical protein ACXWQQ_15875 [Pseudobdellovibrio sp.]